jgi:thiopeptide-type bacteriocin biosynthesis protein
MKEATEYRLLPALFLRAPFYSFAAYDPELLPVVLEDPVFQNALYLASPAFYGVLRSAGFNWEVLSEKEKHTVWKYYNRMSFRPVPFGSFSSFCLTSWGTHTSKGEDPQEKALLHLYPDNGLLQDLSQQKSAGNRPLCRNPMLYRAGKSFRYLRSVPDQKGVFRFYLGELPAGKFQQRLLARFKAGDPGYGALKGWIRLNAACGDEEAAEYLDFLIGEQVLMDASATGLISSSPDLPAGFGAYPLAEAPVLAKLAARIGAGKYKRDLFYAALERTPGHIRTDAQDSEDLLAAAGALQRLALPVVNTHLRQFITDFENRFDLQKVPLLQALDPDQGILYRSLATTGDGVLAGLPFPDKAGAAPGMDWTQVHRLLFRRWISDTGRKKEDAIVIRREDLDALEQESPAGRAPNTITVMFRKTRGQLQIEHAGGAPAAALIGRFSLFSGQVADFGRELAAIESAANPDVLFAEIDQRSNLHVDNISRRMPFYSHTIPVNAWSALPARCIIPPGDLLLSVANGELQLESATLGKRVIPRFSSAFNYQHNELSLFRFLADLQHQGLQTSLTFDPAQFFPGLEYYPRFLFEDVVICPAKWVFGEMELNVIMEIGDGVSPLRAMRLFCKQHGLPQTISVGEYDQQLVIDLGDAAEIRSFCRSITGKKQMTIREYLPPDRSVKENGQPLAAQFIAFLAQGQQVYGALPQPGKARAKNNAGVYPPGADWLYLRMYCTTRAANELLHSAIYPAIRRGRSKVHKWFFIRYNERGHHIRLRLQIAASDVGYFLSTLNKLLERTGGGHLVRNMEADTYRPELERYGEGTMDLAEDLFCTGSALVVHSLATGNSKAFGTELMLAACSALVMISAFLTAEKDRLHFVAGTRDSFLAEFSADKALKTGLDSGFRASRKQLTGYLERLPALMAGKSKMGIMFRSLSRQVEDIAAASASRAPDEQVRLLADLIHMQMNRTFSSESRKQELLVYYYLQEYLSGEVVRKRLKSTAPAC